MHTQITTFVQIAEFVMPFPTPQPVVFEPVRASRLSRDVRPDDDFQPAEGGIVREFTARVLRASAEGGLRLADRIAPERDAA